jgi:GNAT superfamily N-acetyltransferase
VSSVIEYAPAATLSLEALAELFTRSFEQYFYPATVSAADLSWRVRVEDIDLWRSLVLRVGGEDAGVALLSIRPGAAWCGGFGVTLPRRGRGLAHGLAAEMVAQALEAGVARLRLEVLTRNQRAYKTYERAGFRVTRDLLIVEWRREGRPPFAPPEVRAADYRLLLRSFDALHPHEPAWQRDLPSLLTRGPLQGYALGDPEQPRAYALVQPLGEDIARVVDLAADDAEAAGEVLTALQARFVRVSSVNEPEGSPQALALLAAGFAEVDRQHEMDIWF